MNDIRSVYGKDAVKVLRWIESGKLLVTDRRKAEAWVEGTTRSNSGRHQPTLIAESQATNSTPANWGQ